MDRMKRQNFSKKREAIFRSICSTDTHPTAEWVYNQLKPEFPDLSLGTVYRNISMFKERGMVISVGTVNGQERFDWNVKPHPHFICTKCGAVIDVNQITGDNRSLDYSVASAYGFQVDYHSLCFFGTCAACMKDGAEETKLV